jgi:hypothetical protein
MGAKPTVEALVLPAAGRFFWQLQPRFSLFAHAPFPTGRRNPGTIKRVFGLALCQYLEGPP